MDDALELATKYKELLPFAGIALATFFAALWTVIQFALTQRRDRQKHVFETYHKLVEDLVDSGGQGRIAKIDRQCAIIYELRFYSRYRSVTRRMLLGLQSTWGTPTGAYPRIAEEIDLTLKALPKRFWHRD